MFFTIMWCIAALLAGLLGLPLVWIFRHLPPIAWMWVGVSSTVALVLIGTSLTTIGVKLMESRRDDLGTFYFLAAIIVSLWTWGTGLESFVLAHHPVGVGVLLMVGPFLILAGALIPIVIDFFRISFQQERAQARTE